MVCRKYKIYVSAYERSEGRIPIYMITYMPIMSKLYPYSLIKGCENYTIRDFCSDTGPTMCHENMFLTHKIFGVGSSNLGCVNTIRIIGQHTK